jgi:hypothetical protein
MGKNANCRINVFVGSEKKQFRYSLSKMHTRLKSRERVHEVFAIFLVMGGGSLGL